MPNQTKSNQTAHDSEKEGWNATHYSCTSETLWRKLNNLKPSFSHNKELYVFKRGQRKCSCIRGQILLTRNKNHRKSVCMWNMWNKSHLLCQEKKNLWEQAEFWHLAKVVCCFPIPFSRCNEWFGLVWYVIPKWWRRRGRVLRLPECMFWLSL